LAFVMSYEGWLSENQQKPHAGRRAHGWGGRCASEHPPCRPLSAAPPPPLLLLLLLPPLALHQQSG
jgi:hypothetical protein